MRIAKFIAAALVAGGCSEPVPPPAVDADAAFRFAEAQVAVGARPAGSAGAEKLYTMLKQQVMPYPGKTEENSIVLPDGRVIRNLVYWHPRMPENGERYVILGAHYDTKVLTLAPDFQGANDGASGVAALLAILQSIDNNPPLPVCFVFFDGEEALVNYSDTDGLHGSKLWAETLRDRGLVKNCAAMILLDMIGDKDLNVRFPADTDAGLLKTVLKLAEGDRRFAAGGAAMLDDHIPFQELGIPAIDFIDFDYGPGNAYWHTRHDTLDKISGQSIKAAADLALRLIWTLGEEG